MERTDAAILLRGLSCLRVKENSCLITVSHSSEYLTSLSELFQWQLVRFLSGLAFGHLLQSGTSQNATLQKRREGHPIPLVTITRQAVYKCCHRCARNKPHGSGQKSVLRSCYYGDETTRFLCNKIRWCVIRLGN